LRSAHRGIERQRVWLGTAIPGDTVGNFGSGLELLSQRATYLYGEGNRYWYDTQPSVARTAADHAEGLRDRPEEVWGEIVSRLRTEQRSRGGFAGVHLAPDSSADVADTEDARLVILHPSRWHSKGDENSEAMRFAQDAFERRGSGQRTNRNMVVFLAPDGKRLEELNDSVRHYLAWTWVEQRKDDLNLTPQQVRQVETNRSRSGEAVTARVAQTYYWALVPEQLEPSAPPKITIEKADGANERLAERVTEKLTRAGLLTGSIAARSIRLELDQKLTAVWSKGHVAMGELWGYYCRYPYLTRLRDRTVLDDGASSALISFMWEQEAFALADSYDDTTGRYSGLTLPSGDAHFGQITDTTLLVVPEVAQRQLADTVPDAPTVASDEPGEQARAGEPIGDRSGAPAARSNPSNTRYFGVYKLDPERYGRDLARLGQEILMQLAAVEDAQLEITVEVHASSADGFPDDKVRTVLENARTLKFEQSGFEDD
jgi:hypothetical protein